MKTCSFPLSIFYNPNVGGEIRISHYIAGDLIIAGGAVIVDREVVIEGDIRAEQGFIIKSGKVNFNDTVRGQVN